MGSDVGWFCDGGGTFVVVWDMGSDVVWFCDRDCTFVVQYGTMALAFTS